VVGSWIGRQPDLGEPGEPVADAGVLVAFDDDPAAARLLRYLLSPGAGRIWVSTGTVVSSNNSSR
jgi:hypothetical protein